MVRAIDNLGICKIRRSSQLKRTAHGSLVRQRVHVLLIASPEFDNGILFRDVVPIGGLVDCCERIVPGDGPILSGSEPSAVTVLPELNHMIGTGERRDRELYRGAGLELVLGMVDSITTRGVERDGVDRCGVGLLRFGDDDAQGTHHHESHSRDGKEFDGGLLLHCIRPPELF